MEREKDIDKELKNLKKAREDLNDICYQLECYKDRMALHTKAIDELQDFVLTDREAITKLAFKVDKIEKKYGSDVMYQ